MTVSRSSHTISFLCLLLFLFTPGLKSDWWETLRSRDIRQVQIPAGEVASLYEAPEKKASISQSMFSRERELPLLSLVVRQECSTWGMSSYSCRSQEAQRSSQDYMQRRQSSDLWGPWNSTPSLRHPGFYPVCKVLHLLSLLWPLAEPEDHRSPILLTC